MKNSFRSLLFGTIALFWSLIFFNSIHAKAYEMEVDVVNSTENSITLDFTNAFKDCIADYKEEGTTAKFTSVYIGYIEEPCDRNKIKVNKKLKTSTRQYTITGLKPDTTYYIRIDTSVDLVYKDKTKGVGFPYFRAQYACTTQKTSSAKLLGVTGTTATVDFRDSLKAIQDELLFFAVEYGKCAV